MGLGKRSSKLMPGFPDFEHAGRWDGVAEWEVGFEASDIAFRVGARKVEVRPPQPSVPLVLSSSKKFDWGKVDPNDPLGPHRSLLERLAGMGTALPGS